jgi:enoyl-CoA hydratase/carnithine racemase
MSTVTIEACDKVAVLRLNHQTTNAINSRLIDDCRNAIGRIQNEFRAMVLAGNAKFFCIGIDLPELIQLDRKDMQDYWYRFNQLTLDLFTLPLPTVSALCGHAIGGGCILSLTSDFRWATSARKQIGLNELNLGVPVPYLTDLILRQIVGDRVATDMIYQGSIMPLTDAKDTGLIDEICDPETVEDNAVQKANILAAFQGPAFSAVKATRVEAIRLRYEQHHQQMNDVFLDCWFSEPVQQKLAEAARKF